MKVKVKRRAGVMPEEEIQTEFKTHIRFPIFLSIAGIILLSILAVATAFHRQNTRFDLWFYFIVVMIKFVVDILDQLDSRLIISVEGITCCLPLYQVYVKWDEIKQIERRAGMGWLISCHSSEVKAIFFVAWWLKFIENDRIISLDRFAKNFAESKLLTSIYYFAPNMVFMTEE
jgi:hypothetical protein